ncbi:MAG: FGGY-family carbohydrate kinase [Candidatus Promineofilum sp.]|nr:FGGY-family carbohydrate kinase [Promineifilum sp.]
MNPLILAIDLGTSGPKVALVTPQGQVVDCRAGACRLTILPGGGAEQAPDEWWAAIRATLAELLAANPDAVGRIAAIGCTSQWSGTVAVGEDGRPLMNAIIWMDARGAPYVAQITDGLIKLQGYGLRRLVTWLRLTGGLPAHSGKDSIAHILFIKHQYPDVYRRTYRFLEPKDYLNLRLTGLYAASHESITLHWLTDNRDINNVHYDDQLLRWSTVDRAKLPDLRRAIDILGPLRPDVAAELGLPAGIPVIVGTPDMHSAAVGSGAVGDFQPHLYIGTSSWLTCHVPYKKTDLFHNMASLPSAVPGKYFIADEQETAGACLAFLRDNILYADDLLAREQRAPNVYPLFDQMVAATEAGSGKLIFTPWLHGERTPVDDRHVRGGFHNLSLRHTRAEMIRAVFEGVAYNSRWLLRYVERFTGRRLDGIRMVGGGANSDVWCQIHADVLDRTVRQVKEPVQVNVRGVGLLAAVACGLTNFDQIGDVEIARTYEPNPAHRALYDELFAAFEAIYKQNNAIYRRLNRG